MECVGTQCAPGGTLGVLPGLSQCCGRYPPFGVSGPSMRAYNRKRWSVALSDKPYPPRCQSGRARINTCNTGLRKLPLQKTCHSRVLAENNRRVGRDFLQPKEFGVWRRVLSAHSRKSVVILSAAKNLGAAQRSFAALRMTYTSSNLWDSALRRRIQFRGRGAWADAG
jgi:hypothetical protein